ncbi:MAG TPA: hypothetical protein VHQ20_00455 [Patescibacteria group bacterium]|jgi:hypothetical protein|nr:hypothetical protein [Patescibacteria group bacterium]
MEHMESGENFEQNLAFQAPPENEVDVQPEKKEQKWKEKPTEQLTVSDFENLDREGQEYISNILIYKSFERDPFVSLEDLESTFRKAVAFIKEHDPNATFAQMAGADRAKLRASLKHCLPEGMPSTIEELVFNDSAKQDFKKALGILREQANTYKSQNADLFNEPSLVGKASAFFKGAIRSSNPNDELKNIVANQLALYDRLENSPTITDADLETPVLYEETDTNVYKTGPLSLALSSGRKIYVPSLARYLEQRASDLKIPGRALLDRLIDSFGQIAKGEVQVESESDIKKDLKQINNRTYSGPKSGTYKEFETKSFETLRIKSE